ncbi:phage tail sheath family protein [Undibacterium sp. KW1]|uniref:phage tail sheath family protein n=1 Tax=Undibacterium sp. KW1 TaxID=2058624 RepID=UPI0013899727|nr:phage tail sheath family protein [Undibacterium sp. KW1]
MAVRQRHQSLMAVSPLYQTCMNNIATSVNLLPPAAAMAGVYARTDHTFGVFQSPANTTIINAISPVVTISDQEQGSLNVPLNGLAVNAIRMFPNYGLLVWGARTLAGNSDDWRYISVRRTAMMIEQSVKAALQAYVFQANDNLTWTSVSAVISNFLNAQWKYGALVGSKPADAYSVSVGLGTAMTAQDILDGVMNVTVMVALVHPAEFIVLTFQQQMQTS